MSRYDDERREYEADVIYEAWRRGYNPDRAVECARDCYYDGRSPDECVDGYARRQRHQRELRGRRRTGRGEMSVDRKRLRELALAVASAGCAHIPDAPECPVCNFRAAANPQTILALLDALDAAEQPTDDARDARRYRLLRERVDSYWWHGLTETGAAFDAAIDAAIAEQAKERT